MASSNVDDDHKSATDSLLYAHRHIPSFLNIKKTPILPDSYDDPHELIQVVTDGRQLTKYSIGQGTISIHVPILVTDTPESIGMRVKIPRRKSPFDRNSNTIDRRTNSRISKTRKRHRNSRKGNHDDDDYDDDDDCDDNRSSSNKTGDIVRSISNMVGPNQDVNVIDVKLQKELEGWTFGTLSDYFDDEKRLMEVHKLQQLLQESSNVNAKQQAKEADEPTTTRRPRRKVTLKNDTIANLQVLNQVSYEFSRTELSQYVSSPTFVREIDWIDIAWPAKWRWATSENNNTTNNPTARTTIASGDPIAATTSKYPVIQYYCLTSGAGSYMDYHIDFGGTSVWYHIVSGRKEFCLIQPTLENLIQYENWICSPNQEKQFLPNNIADQNTVLRIVLKEHQTMIIPSGWIHAVYTPVDSVVFGGNFLHGFDIQMQITVNDIELRRKVLEKYRCPYFQISNLYASGMYYKKMLAGEMTQQEVEEVQCLICTVKKWWEKWKKESYKAITTTATDNVVSPPPNDNEPTFEDSALDVANENNCESVDEFLMKLENEYNRIRKDGICRSPDLFKLQHHSSMPTPNNDNDKVNDNDKLDNKSKPKKILLQTSTVKSSNTMVASTTASPKADRKKSRITIKPSAQQRLQQSKNSNMIEKVTSIKEDNKQKPRLKLKMSKKDTTNIAECIKSSSASSLQLDSNNMIDLTAPIMNVSSHDDNNITHQQLQQECIPVTTATSDALSENNSDEKKSIETGKLSQNSNSNGRDQKSASASYNDEVMDHCTELETLKMESESAGDTISGKTSHRISIKLPTNVKSDGALVVAMSDSESKDTTNSLMTSDHVSGPKQRYRAEGIDATDNAITSASNDDEVVNNSSEPNTQSMEVDSAPADVDESSQNNADRASSYDKTIEVGTEVTVDDGIKLSDSIPLLNTNVRKSKRKTNQHDWSVLCNDDEDYIHEGNDGADVMDQDEWNDLEEDNDKKKKKRTKEAKVVTEKGITRKSVVGTIGNRIGTIKREAPTNKSVRLRLLEKTQKKR